MPVPSLQGDNHGVHTKPDSPPIAGAVTSGSSKVLVEGRSVALQGKTISSVGLLRGETLVSSKTLIEGRPVVMVGAVVSIPPPGYTPAPINGPGASKTLIG